MEALTTLRMEGGNTTYTRIRGPFLLELLRKKDLQLWDRNRDLEEERVTRLVRGQLARLDQKKGTTLFLPVPITVCSYAGSLYLIDGQHRAAVLKRLSELRPGATDDTELLLCTVRCGSSEEMEDVFERVNAGTPVPAAYYTKKVNTVISTFLERLIKAYPGVDSKAAHPTRPNFNIKAVKDLMSSHIGLRDMVIDGRIASDDLYELAVAENGIEKEKCGLPGGTRHLPDRCLSGAAKSNFYLGLQKEWPHTLALRAIAKARADDQALALVPT